MLQLHQQRTMTMSYKFIQQPKTRPNNMSTDPDNLTWKQVFKIVQKMFDAGCTYSNKAPLEQYAKKNNLTFKDASIISIMLDRYIAEYTTPWSPRRK